MAECSHMKDCFYHKVWKALKEEKDRLKELQNIELSEKEHEDLIKDFIKEKFGVILPEEVRIQVSSKNKGTAYNNEEKIHYLLHDEEWSCEEDDETYRQYKSRW